MNIKETEKQAAKELIQKFLAEKNALPYANIGSGNEYLGWISDFRLKDSKGKTMQLDLRRENDLFLLFALAIGWSRSTKWENSPYFVSYLKLAQYDKAELWLDKSFCLEQQNMRYRSAELIEKELTGIKIRTKVNFRKDVYESLHVLANNWRVILQQLNKAETYKDYISFMHFMGSIEGLGVGKKTMKKKIPLILRELRCQNRFPNIPGELCCVTDNRVLKAAEELDIDLSKQADLHNLILCSHKIYALFGDLYDIPLFAYEDLVNII